MSVETGWRVGVSREGYLFLESTLVSLTSLFLSLLKGPKHSCIWMHRFPDRNIYLCLGMVQTRGQEDDLSDCLGFGERGFRVIGRDCISRDLLPRT